MKTKTKPARGKAVVRYQYHNDSIPTFLNDKPIKSAGIVAPVAVCDLSPAECEARVELAAKAVRAHRVSGSSWKKAGPMLRAHYLAVARAALIAVGVISAPEKQKGAGL